MENMYQFPEKSLDIGYCKYLMLEHIRKFLNCRKRGFVKKQFPKCTLNQLVHTLSN